MDPAHLAVFTVLVPAATAAIVLLLGVLLRRREPVAPAAGWALAAGYAAGHAGTAAVPPFPADETWKWPFWLAAAALVAVTVESLGRRGALVWAIRTALAAAVAWLSLLHHDALPLIAVAASVLVLAAFLDVRTLRDDARSVLPTVIVLAVATSVVLERGHWAIGMQFAGGLAAAAGGSVAVCLFTKRGSAGIATAAATLLAALLANGVALTSASRIATALIVAAPAASLVPLPAAWRERPWRFGIVRAALVAVPAAVAIGIAVASAEPVEW